MFTQFVYISPVKTTKRTNKEPKGTPIEDAEQAPVRNQQQSATGVESEYPPPEHLMEEAEKELPRRLVDEYWVVIQHLREKRFTFREIGEWLSDRGVPADHNAVYRAYTKRMSEAQRFDERAFDEEEEEREAEVVDIVYTPATMQGASSPKRKGGESESRESK